MIAAFFWIMCHVATAALEDQWTVNADWYITICLPELIDESRKTNQNRCITITMRALTQPVN